MFQIAEAVELTSIVEKNFHGRLWLGRHLLRTLHGSSIYYRRADALYGTLHYINYVYLDEFLHAPLYAGIGHSERHSWFEDVRHITSAA